MSDDLSDLRGFKDVDDVELIRTEGGNKVRVDAQGHEIGCTETWPVKGHFPTTAGAIYVR